MDACAPKWAIAPWDRGALWPTFFYIYIYIFYKKRISELGCTMAHDVMHHRSPLCTAPELLLGNMWGDIVDYNTLNITPAPNTPRALFGFSWKLDFHGKCATARGVRA
jgi:hypothetical protein